MAPTNRNTPPSTRDGSVGTILAETGSTTITKATGGYNFYNQSSAYFADAAGKPHVLIACVTRIQRSRMISILARGAHPHPARADQRRERDAHHLEASASGACGRR